MRDGIMKDQRNDFIYGIEKITDLFFFLDILVNFVTPVTIDNDRVTDFKEIAKEYMTHWFIIDLLSCFPLDELFVLFGLPARWSVYSRLLRGIKLVRLFKIFRSNDSDEIGSDNYAVRAIWYLVGSHVHFTIFCWSLWMILVFHTLACYWFWLGRFNDHESWGFINKFNNDSDLDFYIASVYFVMQTFTSTGYGDIQSRNYVELLTRVFMIIFGVVLYSLFTGKLSDEISKTVTEGELVSEKLKALQRLSDAERLEKLTTNRITDSIQAKALKNAEHVGLEDCSDLKGAFLLATNQEQDQEVYNWCSLEYGKICKLPLFKPLPTDATPLNSRNT